MKLIDLVTKAPYICGVTDPERWAEIGRIIFEMELSDSNSVFARKEDDEIYPEKRIMVGCNFVDGDEEKIDYYKNLLILAMYSSYAKKEDSRKYDEVIALATENLKANPQPEFEEVYSVEAATRGAWD